MANVSAKNVRIIDTSAALEETIVVKAVKLVAGAEAAATVEIKQGGSSGQVVYESSTLQETEKLDEEACFRIPKGSAPYVTITGTGAKAYIYLK